MQPEALLPDYEPPARPVHLVCLPDRRVTPQLRRFVDLIVKRFGANASTTVRSSF
jgi:DNA-binding transcriptional LysR family regulator